MNTIVIVGLDLAKIVFHAVCCDQHQQIVKKKMLKRGQLLKFFSQLPPCLIGMEACAGAHYWGRQLRALGHQVKLIPPHCVTPLVQGNKNDFNDGLAIVEALGRPRIHFVEIKTIEQQDMQALYRMRQRCLKERTALCNQARGLLAEYGIVLPKGISFIRSRLPTILEDAENGLSVLFRRLLAHSYQQLKELDAHIDSYTLELKVLSQQDEACQRLQTIPGFGPIVSSVFRSVVGNGAAFRRGRDVSASLGLVPKQHSSGGKAVLRGISKRGDCYLRGLLIHGARAVMNQSARKQDPLSHWINRLKAERGVNRAVVALANKMARMGWAVLSTGTVYTQA